MQRICLTTFRFSTQLFLSLQESIRANLCIPICFLRLSLNSLALGESKSLNNGVKVIKDATTSALPIFKTSMMSRETTSTRKTCSPTLTMKTPIISWMKTWKAPKKNKTTPRSKTTSPQKIKK